MYNPPLYLSCHLILYLYIQGRIQDLAQGGTNRARSARKIFCPPPELLRGGTVPPLKLHSPKILHHLLNEFTRKYQEKNLCPPPESLRGGTFWLSPPWIAQAGDNSQGGTVPPLKLLRGGTVPYFPPVSALVYIYIWNCKKSLESIQDHYIESKTKLDSNQLSQQSIHVIFLPRLINQSIFYLLHIYRNSYL